MKKLRVAGLGILMAAVIAGCGGESATETAHTGVQFETVEKPVAAPTEASTEEVVEEPEEVDPDQPPEEGMVRDFFTNEWVAGDQNTKRPLAVMYPVNKQAQPQYGLDKVRVFYEIMEEGDMSRQMGILEDWEGLERIGNIRSIRDYFIYAALEYDPIIIHYGGPELYLYENGGLLNRNTRNDIDNINGVGGKMGSDGGAFFRVPAGSTSEHTAFTDGAHVTAAMEKLKYQATHKDSYIGEKHFQFAPIAEPNTLEKYGSEAKDAKEIDMAGSYPATKSALSYNDEDGLYYKTLYGNKQVDAETQEQLSFKNIVIQNTYYEKRDAKGYLAFRMHDTTRDGYFITGGKMIHINWKKTGDYEPTHYYDDNGEEVLFNTGRTMIFVVKAGGTFEVDGETINLKK
ncbi:MAG: DUF3048 domain-containing protein [Lachnospiraceae bacterium]|nr:DUF3048 domain-containing protein [Lachnospiraceae bacterium]